MVSLPDLIHSRCGFYGFTRRVTVINTMVTLMDREDELED